MTLTQVPSIPTSTPPDTASFLSREHGLLIGGTWRPSRTGRTLTSVNPATGRPLATLADADGADVDAAVAGEGAALAHPRWCGTNHP